MERDKEDFYEIECRECGDLIGYRDDAIQAEVICKDCYDALEGE